MRTQVVWLTTVLLIGFIGLSPSHAQEVVNLLPNGGFETGFIGPYGIYGNGTIEVVTDCVGAAVPEGPVEGQYCLHVMVPAAGVNDWDVGMSDGSYTFEKGKKYTFSAFLKCKSGTLQFRMKPERGANPYEGYGDSVFTMTEEWQEFSVTTAVFTADVTSASPTFHFAFAAGNFWIDGVRLYEGDYVPQGSSLFGIPTNLGSTVNSAYWEASPSISADGLALFFDSDRPVGSGERDLYVTTRATKDDDWDRPVNLGQSVNTSFYDGQPGISADGRSLYFSSDRPGGFDNQDLWVTTRPTTNDEWDTPVNLGATVNSSAHDTEPSISTDGLTLFFDSDRPGGYGSWDIWMVTRASTDDHWRTPVPLPPPVNSVFSDVEPSISVDGRTLYFCSNRPGGYGTFDLWVATQETTDDEWGTPINLGPTVNTIYHDWGPSISADGSMLYFTAEHVRNLCQNDYDLWQVSLEVPGLTVPGTACIFFAGQDGASLETGYPPDPIGLGDHGNFHNDTVLTANSMPPSIEVYGGGKLSISAVGVWNRYADIYSGTGPDGSGFYDDTHDEYVYLGGISRVIAPVNTLVGVFLTDDPPDPAAMPVSLTLGDDMTTPQLQQAFAIGSSLESITVPEGATRLFFGHNDGYEWNNNIGSVEVTIDFNPPFDLEPPDDPDTSDGFDLYLDYIAPNIINSSRFDNGILDYYCQDNPASGNYCIHWAGVGQYSTISFRFVPVKDLSVLMDEGYVIDFWVRCNSPDARIGIRFIDTKTNDPTDHPWRMLYIVNRSVAAWDGRWNHLQIPLNDFFEHGSWDNDRWYGPIGAFDWTATEYFEIVAEYHDLTGIHFYFDDIHVVDPSLAGQP